MDDLSFTNFNLAQPNLLPKISVITVTYNSAQTVEKTIQSVINQQYLNLEYIIIDGGSTDETINIVKRYYPHVSKLISEQDRGIYDAMNKGIHIASGDILGIINSDDFYLEGAFEKVIYEAIKHPSSEVLYGNIIYNVPGRPLCLLRSKYPLRKSDFCYMPLMHPAVFIRQSCYKKYGSFDMRYRLSADHDLMLRLLEAKVEFHYLDEAIAQMQAGGASTKNLEGVREIQAILWKHNASLYTLLRSALYFSRVAIVQLSNEWKMMKQLLHLYHHSKDLIQKAFDY